jgi:sugar lactone lactonase YvrE
VIATTLAGNPAGDSYGTALGMGYADGTGEDARFGEPRGLAIDLSGNIIVGDFYNNRIRKVTPAGVVTTLAGSGLSAFSDGTGDDASFYQPYGVAVDLSGNIIVADGGNRRIRNITNPGGVVTTLAGGSQGSADGIGTGASFYEPIGLAIDKSGKVIVADFKNNRIRRITNPGGVVTTLAGSGTGTLVDGTGTGASFFYPRGVAIDSGGNIIVADTQNNRIRKITNPGGVVTTLAGRGESGSQSMNQGEDTFSLPMGVAVDSNDNIIVADTNRNCLRFLQFP